MASQVKGIEVTVESTNAIEAYNFLQEYDVDLVPLDIEMPGMTGLELAKNMGNKKISSYLQHLKKNMQQKPLN